MTQLDRLRRVQITMEKSSHISNIWFQLDSAIHAGKNRGPFDIWKITEEHQNTAKYRPRRIDRAELAEITGRHGETSYMLHNLVVDSDVKRKRFSSRKTCFNLPVH